MERMTRGTPRCLSATPGLGTALVQRASTIVAAALIGALLGVVASMAVPVTYRATTTVYLADPATTGVFGSGPPVLGFGAAVESTRELVASEAFLGAVADAIDAAPDDVEDRLSAAAQADVGAVLLTARGASADAASRLATAAVAELERAVERDGEEWADLTGSALGPLERRLRSQLAAVDARLRIAGEAEAAAVTAERAALFERLLEVEARQDEVEADARFTGAAAFRSAGIVVPKEPVTPPPTLTIAVGSVLGLLAGVAVAWRHVERDPRVRDRREPKRVLAAPLLGWLAARDRWPVAQLRTYGALAPAAPGRLRTGAVVSSLEADEPGTLPRLHVRGVGPSDDADRAALSLAKEAARSGRRVLLTGVSRTGRPGDGPTPGEVDAGAFVCGAGTVRVFDTDDPPPSITGDLVVARSGPVLGDATASIMGPADALRRQAIVVVVNRGCRYDDLVEAAETLDLEGAAVQGYLYIDEPGTSVVRRRPAGGFGSRSANRAPAEAG